jgi:hypothetical protein
MPAPPAPGGCFLDRALILSQIERLTASNTLHGSESLCRLLRYLANHSLERPGASPKEYQIATEVFGRSSSFDPQVDSTVRVQAGRLRSKLGDYYVSEGLEDHIVVELPRGMYALNFHPRGSANGKAGTNGTSTPAGLAGGAPVSQADKSSAAATPRVFRWLPLLTALLFLAIASIAVLLVKERSSARAARQPIPQALKTFWNAFLTGADEPWVIFSNAEFVGRPDRGMRYFNSKKNVLRPGEVLLDHYTGVGEVLAVHNLDILFTTFERSLRLKRGSLFSLDDAKNNDLIFIGSPSENLTLLEIPVSKEFVFRMVPEGARKGNTEILNFHPQPSEAQEYLATPANQPLTEDYAVITLARGLNPAHSLMILAGTTTLGTQAAVEYVTRANSVEELLRRLGANSASEVRPFEALLKVRVARGVPVGEELVAVRPR